MQSNLETTVLDKLSEQVKIDLETIKKGVEASDRERIEFPLTIYPAEIELIELKEAIASFQEYFKVKTPYIAVIKALLYASKVMEAKANGKDYYYTGGYKRKPKKA